MGRNEINDYVIYKIVCLSNPDLLYVGSTANFYARRHTHKSSCNNPNNEKHNHKKYVAIRENGGWDNWNMVIVDEPKQITLIKSRMIEEEWRVKLNANLNSIKCFITNEESKEQEKQYRNENADKIKEWHKQNRINNSDELNEKSKQYRNENADKIKEWHIKNYIDNEKHFKKKHTCECGGVYTITHKSRHEKSKKHIHYLENIY